jgi:radical SAM enzyme (TIGR01210 family)
MTEVSGHDLLFQYAEALNKFSYCLKDIKEIDLLSPGSFLCNKEVDPTFQNQVMTEIAKLRDVKRVVIESRPEFVNQGVLRELSSHLREDQLLEIALGIESSNDHIRNDIIGKGFSWSDIEETLKHCAASGTAVQFYLVIKPPTLNEYESIVDGMRSASAVANAAHKYNVPFRIAFQPIFVPVGSDLERQFDLGQYSLVNLWSVIEIIKNTHYLGTMSVALEDENLSKGRRPSTCNICSAKVMIAIDDFNASQNVNVFKRLSCPCKNRWRESLMQLMRQAEQKRGGSLYSARNVIY